MSARRVDVLDGPRRGADDLEEMDRGLFLPEQGELKSIIDARSGAATTAAPAEAIEDQPDRKERSHDHR